MLLFLFASLSAQDLEREASESKVVTILAPDDIVVAPPAPNVAVTVGRMAPPAEPEMVLERSLAPAVVEDLEELPR